MTWLEKHRVIRVILVIGIVLLLLIAAVLIFLRVHPVFGARPDGTDRADYEKRAQGYFDGKRFYYPDKWAISGVSSDERISQKNTVPEDPLPVCEPEWDTPADPKDVRITWLGHSSLLMELGGKTLLIDPIFSQRSSPFSFVGPRRYTAPSVNIMDLPHIDAVLITHDHYDHLDRKTIRALESKTDRFIVPLGIEKHIRRWIKEDDKVINLAWWEKTELDGLSIICTPARHMSGRAVVDMNSTLFCSWVFRYGTHQIFESGDTGYGGHFEEIHRRYGDFDLILTDCAQFNERWHYIHMFPEESAIAAETLRAKAVMPIHWGAFVLSNHGWDDPPERVTLACEARGIEVITPKLCEMMSLKESKRFHERWWRDYP